MNFKVEKKKKLAFSIFFSTESKKAAKSIEKSFQIKNSVNNNKQLRKQVELSMHAQPLE